MIAKIVYEFPYASLYLYYFWIPFLVYRGTHYGVYDFNHRLMRPIIECTCWCALLWVSVWALILRNDFMWKMIELLFNRFLDVPHFLIVSNLIVLLLPFFYSYMIHRRTNTFANKMACSLLCLLFAGCFASLVMYYEEAFKYFHRGALPHWVFIQIIFAAIFFIQGLKIRFLLSHRSDSMVEA